MNNNKLFSKHCIFLCGVYRQDVNGMWMTVPASSPYYPINTREDPLCPSPSRSVLIWAAVRSCSVRWVTERAGQKRARPLIAVESELEHRRARAWRSRRKGCGFSRASKLKSVSTLATREDERSLRTSASRILTGIARARSIVRICAFYANVNAWMR